VSTLGKNQVNDNALRALFNIKRCNARVGPLCSPMQYAIHRSTVAAAGRWGTMMWAEHALLFTQTHRDIMGPTPISLIDCGARGDIPEPWANYVARFQGGLKVLGFEADPTEAARLNATHGSKRTYVPAAAWNASGTATLYITDPAQTSSLFPPNAAVDQLYTFHGAQYHSVARARSVKRTTKVATTTVDEHASGIDADVLKIDTQGAEYEILEGAKTTLTSSLFAVIAETWTAEIYKGAKPAWDVMRLMHDQGYTLMTTETAGLARRSFPDTPTFKFVQQEQIVGMELLFFRNSQAFVRHAADATKVFKAVGIADVYGFPDVSVELLQEIVMRWPNEIGNVQRCYKELLNRRANTGNALADLYPKLHG
jgi:FkbM family methyltransferase